MNFLKRKKLLTLVDLINKYYSIKKTLDLLFLKNP